MLKIVYYDRLYLMIGRNMNILLVEDDIDLLEFEEVVFKKNFKGSVVVTAKNGKEALELCQSQTFDIIVTDINMPIMNGFKFIENLETQCPNAFNKIYVVSGYFDNEKVSRKAITKYFHKPINYETLVTNIKDDLQSAA